MRKILLLPFLLLILFFLASYVHADGILIPKPDYYINETDQKAVIWHDGKTETLIVSTSFQGDAEEFAWIIPVPAKPNVSASTDEVFTGLNQLTASQYQPAYGGISPLAGVSYDTSKSEVSVIETKQVDIYDITVLSAETSEALQQWLEENGYEYPKNKEHLLSSYVNKDWYFVAAKINTDSLSYAGSGLKTGHATPLKIQFDSDKIVYPLKISGKAADLPIEDEDKSNIIAAFSFENAATQGWSGMVSYMKDAFDGNYAITTYSSNRTQYTTTNYITKSISNLTPNKKYVFSAYVKNGAVKGNGLVYITAGDSYTSQSLDTNNINSWTRISLPFTPKTNNVLLSLVLNSNESPQIYWDAIMLEEGTVASQFTKEVIGQVNITPTKIPDQYIRLVIYIFSDHKKEIPGWTVEYAGNISAKTIEKLGYDDMGDPWIKTDKKMYLTKLVRNMNQSQMTSDLYFRDAADNNPVGKGSQHEWTGIFGDLSWRLALVFGFPLIAEIAIIIYIWYKRYRR